MSKQVDIGELIKDAEIVGNIYTGGFYGIDETVVVCREGVRLARGDYIFVKDPEDGLPLVYQIAHPYWYKRRFEFEEALIASGFPIRDKRRSRYKCKAVLLGKINEQAEISLPRVPIPPISDAYRCPPELVRLVTEPMTDWKIKVGNNPETGNPVFISLEPLVRQSLLIAGAQGTGKTTAMLTMIVRSVESNPSLRFLVLDWSGEYVSLREALQDKVSIVPWEKLVRDSTRKRAEILLSLFLADPRMASKAVRSCIMAALSLCREEKVVPNKQAIIEKIEEQTLRRPYTKDVAKGVIDYWIPDEFPEGLEGTIVDLVVNHNVVVIDFSETKEMPDEFSFKEKIGAYAAEEIWNRATTDKEFGCIVISDEAHRICPEFKEFDPIWLKLATEGGRNCCPLWLVARRLSLVSKSITTESQQNFICFNVEDVDRARVESDLGTTFAGMLGSLPQGEAMVKSAMGFRIPGQTIHVKFDRIVAPSSARYPGKARFEAMERRDSS